MLMNLNERQSNPETKPINTVRYRYRTVKTNLSHSKQWRPHNNSIGRKGYYDQISQILFNRLNILY